MSHAHAVKGIIFDLGDVFLKWSPNTKTSISPEVLKKILDSPIWHQYERGDISRTSCYRKVSHEFGLEASQVAEAFSQARASVQPDQEVVSFLEDLKISSYIRLFAMSNVGKEDFADVEKKTDLSLFDLVFTSAAARARKPDLKFYHQVLEKIGLAPEHVLFIDDREENVSAARKVGLNGFVFDGNTVQRLQEILDDPVTRGFDYLSRNRGRFRSITDSGISIDDNFAKLLILEATEDRSLVDINPSKDGYWNFFAEATLVPEGVFPDDLDTTCLGLMVEPPADSQIINNILDRMLECVTADGSILTYFDRERPRTDIVVSANVLACFYHFGRGHQLPRTLEYIHNALLHRRYENGTRYYPSPDCCLGFFARLLQYSKNDAHLQAKIGGLLKPRVQERIGKDGSALDLAMRMIACTSFSVDCNKERERLLALQCEDGSWEPGWMYRYGSTGVKIGNRGVTTALALKALSTKTLIR
ncbi:unnamed protein product [Periconia digitata]|uniref:HAD-like protein n=1 Tax=Periconia digitata TaxID=1303443 RepID=A0A9W4UED3_9PLEO|nr:unnamed protein product [Periconia digitata]